MAKTFTELLKTGLETNKHYLNDKITVVGLIGKDTRQFRISTIVNLRLFHRIVFEEHNNSASTSVCFILIVFI